MAARNRRFLVAGLGVLALGLALFITLSERHDQAPQLGERPGPAETVDASPTLRGPGAVAPQAADTGAAPASSSDVVVGVDDFAVRGRVVDRIDGNIVGVGGVHLRLVRSDAEESAPPLGSATSSVSGAFVLTVPFRRVPVLGNAERTFAYLRGEAPDGRTARASPIGRFNNETMNPFGRGYPVGDIELQATVPVSVVVRGARADRPVELHAASIGGAPLTPFPPRHVVTDEAAQTLLLPSPGTWAIATRAPGTARAQAIVELPEARDTPIELIVVPQREVHVLVVDANDDRPIEGARVHFIEQRGASRSALGSSWWPSEPPSLTDAKGLTRLPAQPTPGIALLVHAESREYPPPFDQQGNPRHEALRGDTSQITLRLARGKTLRWQIDEQSPHIPASGTELRLEGDVNSTSNVSALRASARVDGREVVMEGAPESAFGLFGVTPDGNAAALRYAPSWASLPTARFVPLRRLVVIARTPDGAPVAGVGVQARTSGGNVLAGPIPTDERGRAVLEKLTVPENTIANVYVGPREITLAAQHVGRAKLDGATTTLEVTLLPAVRVVARITTDGAAAVPSGLYVRPTWGEGFVLAPFRSIDGTDNELEATWHGLPGASRIRLEALAPGYPRTAGEAQRGEAGEVHVNLDLLRGGTLTVQLVPPEAQRPTFDLEYWDEGRDAFRSVNYTGLRVHGRFSDDGVLELAGLPDGRYRLWSPSLELASPTIHVGMGKSEYMRWEIPHEWTVAGRVVTPQGASLEDLRVFARPVSTSTSAPANPSNSPPREVIVAKDGSFQISVPANEPIELFVAGHRLRAAREGGTILISSNRDDVVLLTEHAPVAIVRLENVERLEGVERFAIAGADPSLLPVVWEHGSSGGRMLARLVRDRSVIEVSGLAAGRGVLWIDPRKAAPIRLEDVVIDGNRDEDLGSIRLVPGSTLHVRLIVPGAQATDSVQIIVDRGGPFAYSRRLQVDAHDALQATHPLDGLEPGRHDLTAYAATTGRARLAPIKRTIDVPASGEVEITLDFSP